MGWLYGVPGAMTRSAGVGQKLSLAYVFKALPDGTGIRFNSRRESGFARPESPVDVC